MHLTTFGLRRRCENGWGSFRTGQPGLFMKWRAYRAEICISQRIFFLRRILTDICKRKNLVWNQRSSEMPSISL